MLWGGAFWLGWSGVVGSVKDRTGQIRFGRFGEASLEWVRSGKEGQVRLVVVGCGAISYGTAGLGSVGLVWFDRAWDDKVRCDLTWCGWCG